MLTTSGRSEYESYDSIAYYMYGARHSQVLVSLLPTRQDTSRCVGASPSSHFADVPIGNRTRRSPITCQHQLECVSIPHLSPGTA